MTCDSHSLGFGYLLVSRNRVACSIQWQNTVNRCPRTDDSFASAPRVFSCRYPPSPTRVLLEWRLPFSRHRRTRAVDVRRWTSSFVLKLRRYLSRTHRRCALWSYKAGKVDILRLQLIPPLTHHAIYRHHHRPQRHCQQIQDMVHSRWRRPHLARGELVVEV